MVFQLFAAIELIYRVNITKMAAPGRHAAILDLKGSQTKTQVSPPMCSLCAKFERAQYVQFSLNYGSKCGPGDRIGPLYPKYVLQGD